MARIEMDLRSFYDEQIAHVEAMRMENERRIASSGEPYRLPRVHDPWWLHEVIEDTDEG